MEVNTVLGAEDGPTLDPFKEGPSLSITTQVATLILSKSTNIQSNGNRRNQSHDRNQRNCRLDERVFTKPRNTIPMNRFRLSSSLIGWHIPRNMRSASIRIDPRYFKSETNLNKSQKTKVISSQDCADV